MTSLINNIKGKLGFGTLRLPKKEDGKVDINLLSDMVDEYMKNGFNYFDLAHAYMNGQCENAMRQSLIDRYPREEYILCDKLTWEFFKKKEDIATFFETQLSNCNVRFFDVYLLHALTRYKFEKFKKCDAFEVLSELKKQGKIKHIGISFHDKPDFLKELLDNYPEIEVVQIQFNYADYESNIVESRKLYEICEQYNKPVFSMESVKGGSLANLPEDAQRVFDELNTRNGTKTSSAGYALRFVSGFENIKVILSGMSNIAQLKDNINIFKNTKPLSTEEKKAINKVTEIFNSKNMIQCTACRYCVDGCPKHILIPDMFACLNQKIIFNNWNQNYYYRNVLTSKNGKASECIKCGVCEKACPQNLKIRDLLDKVADEFEFRGKAKWIGKRLVYFEKGQKDDKYTGLATTERGNIVYFKDGVFQNKYSGIIRDEVKKELLILNGVHKKITGAFWINRKLIFFDKGIADKKYTGIAHTLKGSLVMMTNGMFNRSFTGLISDKEGRVLFIKDGVFDKTYTGNFKGNTIKEGMLLICSNEKDKEC